MWMFSKQSAPVLKKKDQHRSLFANSCSWCAVRCSVTVFPACSAEVRQRRAGIGPVHPGSHVGDGCWARDGPNLGSGQRPGDFSCIPCWRRPPAPCIPRFSSRCRQWRYCFHVLRGNESPAPPPPPVRLVRRCVYFGFHSNSMSRPTAASRDGGHYSPPRTSRKMQS
jgi:hypothetical protein